MNIYVGNLAKDVTSEDLKQEFAMFGAVTSSAVIKDKMTGDSRGFGFIEMPSVEEAKAAMAALNGKDIKGMNITANEARPKSSGGSGGGRSFGGGYGAGKETTGGRKKPRGVWKGRGW